MPSEENEPWLNQHQHVQKGEWSLATWFPRYKSEQTDKSTVTFITILYTPQGGKVIYLSQTSFSMLQQDKTYNTRQAHKINLSNSYSPPRTPLQSVITHLFSFKCHIITTCLAVLWKWQVP